MTPFDFLKLVFVSVKLKKPYKFKTCQKKKVAVESVGFEHWSFDFGARDGTSLPLNLKFITILFIIHNMSQLFGDFRKIGRKKLNE